MERVIQVEVLDRHGEVRQRVRASRLPFTIGRDYRCDLVLDDPHVDPQHVRIEPDVVGGGLRLRDLDSLNGVMLLDPRRPLAAVPLQSGQRARVGRTVLRFVDESHPVGPALPLADRPRWVAWATDHWFAALALGVAVVAAEMARTYRESYEPLDVSAVASAQLWLVGLLLLWAGGWALVTRMLLHQSRFVAHWGVTCAATLALLLCDEALYLARFVLAPIGPLQVAEAAVETVLTAAALYAHLAVAGVLRRVRRAATAAAVAVGLVGALTLTEYQGGTDWVTVLPYWSRLKPLDPAWIPTESPDEFFAQARELREAVDALAAEEAEAAP